MYSERFYSASILRPKNRRRSDWVFSSTEMIWCTRRNRDAAYPGRMIRFARAQPSQSHHADATKPAILPLWVAKQEEERKKRKRIH